MMDANEKSERYGPLDGIRVVEFGGLGPGPYCAQLLGDLGADVLLIDREGGNGWPNPVSDRNKAKLVLDIRSDEGRQTALKAIGRADVLIEGFRPGVMERLGLGPEAAHELNPRLIYGRMTGWGQDGPLAKSAGHDINYIALTGALAAIGKKDDPASPPLNLVGDFGGGSLFLALGVVSALLERSVSGKGQVIDAAIVDGAASMMSFFAGQLDRISLDREKSVLGGAAPFYRCYICADDKEISVGPIEPHFFAEMLKLIGVEGDLLHKQFDASTWPEKVKILEEVFAQRSQSEWCELLEGTDACFAPVLSLQEAPDHPHMAARGVYQTIDGVLHPAPAPRFSRTPGRINSLSDNNARLATWGLDA